MGLNLPLRSSVKLRERILRNRRRINRAEKKTIRKMMEKRGKRGKIEGKKKRERSVTNEGRKEEKRGRIG